MLSPIKFVITAIVLMVAVYFSTPHDNGNVLAPLSFLVWSFFYVAVSKILESKELPLQDQ